MTERDELNKWAACLPDRRVIEEFLDWCWTTGRRIELAQWGDNSNYPTPVVSRDAVLNEFHGIDAKKLETQRRALLQTASR